MAAAEKAPPELEKVYFSIPGFLSGESWYLDLHGHDALEKNPKNILPNGGWMVMYLGKKWKKIAQKKELQVHPYLGNLWKKKQKPWMETGHFGGADSRILWFTTPFGVTSQPAGTPSEN